MTDTISLTIPTTPRLTGVATLVLGGVGSRLHLPYERADDLQLAALSVLAATDAETVTIEITAADEEVSVAIGPLSNERGDDSGLRRMLDRLVDTVEKSERDGHEWLTLRLRRAPAFAES